MAKTGTKVDARRRARERKAILDAQRAERDEKVEALATDYFEAAGTIESLQSAITEAQRTADDAIRQLLDLGETVDRVATLTDQPAATIRKVKRTAAEQTQPASPDVLPS